MKNILSEWPAPPYYSFAIDSHTEITESCLIYYTNGDKVLGDLVGFSTEESKIIFQPTRDEVKQTVEFEQIKTIRMVRSAVMQKKEIALEDRVYEVFPASERQSYTVEFNDKATISGETIGYTNTSKGLYLYAPADQEKVIRYFIPAQSIKTYQIGLKIGEMLIQENLASKNQVEAAISRQLDLRRQRIGDYLSENQIVTREQLNQAIRHQEGQPILRLGEALIQLELITQEQLDSALFKQKDNRTKPIGQILVDMGMVDQRALNGALAKKLGIPYVSLTKFSVDKSVIGLVSAAFARKHDLIPVCLYDHSLVVAFEDPLNSKAIEELRFLTQLKIVPAMASRDDIKLAISKHYSTDNKSAFDYPEAGRSHDDYDFHAALDIADSEVKEVKIGDLASKLFTEDNNIEMSLEPVAESDNTLVQLVNKMIMDAYTNGVSDIHIETYPGRKNTRVRFRKDGTLTDYLEIPSNYRSAVISRIKIMSQLDISERRKPQDGKIDFQQFGPAKVELRVATIPTTSGLEDIVMRVLAAAKPVAMDKLGLKPNILTTLTRLMERPYGLVLVCGPTGSGKTTTLHSLLGHINTPNRKIWTAEDPIEITQPGLRQVQVNSKIGWTFATAIRSFLRADPDVIMVGEMRDQETAKIGIEASLTGHLVLSTLHTNTAPESVVRLLDLGMDPFNFADALLAVLAQRLAKTLCTQCKEAYTPTTTEINDLLAEFIEGSGLESTLIMQEWQENYANQNKFTLCKAVGCDACGHSGYRGRLGLHELMTVSPQIKKLTQSHAPVSDLLIAAIDAGMRTLKQDGIDKVLQGLTDIGQVRSVCV